VWQSLLFFIKKKKLLKEEETCKKKKYQAKWCMAPNPAAIFRLWLFASPHHFPYRCLLVRSLWRRPTIYLVQRPPVYVTWTREKKEKQ
jgi:hypothetical protein